MEGYSCDGRGDVDEVTTTSRDMALDEQRGGSRRAKAWMQLSFRNLPACRLRTRVLRMDELWCRRVNSVSNNDQRETSLLQRGYCLLCDLPAIANHLHPNLAYLLQLTSGPDCWVGAVARPELTDARRCETALAVVRVGTSAGCEDGSLDLGKHLRWGKEDKFVARGIRDRHCCGSHDERL